jgi:hypothetical protein
MRTLSLLLAGLLAASFTFTSAQADGAFQARTVAEGVVSPHVRGKLIWIRSLIGSGLNNRRWSFLYFDPYADSNGRLVVVQNGSVVKVDQGLVELDHMRVAPYKESEILSPDQLKLDSDAALAALQAAGHIENVPLTTVHYKLETSSENEVPVWSLTLFCPRNGDEIEFAHGRVSASTGQVFDLKVDHKRIPENAGN